MSVSRLSAEPRSEPPVLTRTQIEADWLHQDVKRQSPALPGGGVSREIRVELDPMKLQAQGITAAQVNQQLRQLNLNATGGRAEIAGAEQSVRVLGNASDAVALGAVDNTGVADTISE